MQLTHVLAATAAAAAAQFPCLPACFACRTRSRAISHWQAEEQQAARQLAKAVQGLVEGNAGSIPDYLRHRATRLQASRDVSFCGAFCPLHVGCCWVEECCCEPELRHS
jgi:hypothetical protein